MKTKNEKRRKAKAALKINQKARTELAKLLKRDQAGTITRAKLDTGLKEIHEDLQMMLRFVRASL